MLWLLYLAIGVSILAMRGHATEIWCIFGDKYVRCTLISAAAKGDQSISCNPRFLLHGNILCRGRFLPMDIMKRCLQGITLNWLLCTGHYFYPHQYLKCLKNWKCSIEISRLYMLSLIKGSPPFSLWVLYLYLHLFWTLRCKVSRGQLSIVQFSLTTDVGAQ